jgi:hypothetical protein
VISNLKLSTASSFGLMKLAKHWSSEPGARTKDEICQSLLDAYWGGEFSKLASPLPEHWPDSGATYKILRFCCGLPAIDVPNRDGDWPDQVAFVGIPFNKYPPQGQAALKGVEFYKDMVELWCLDQGHVLPQFWFKEEDRMGLPGRPSISNRILSQLKLRFEQNELQNTLAAQARVLHEWASNNLGHKQQIPKPQSIENIIRGDYRRLKNMGSSKSH